MTENQNTFDIIIMGGGTGGITVAAQLLKNPSLQKLTQGSTAKIAIVDPAEFHFYQPIWTLVGGGVFPKEVSRKYMRDVIPEGATWIQDEINSFIPEKNQLKTKTGKTLQYTYLVLSPGMEIFWDRIENLKNSVGHNGVCSNYSYDTVDSTWTSIQKTNQGRTIFTFPNTPIKCGGAPQKIMYLAESCFRKRGVRNNVEVLFASAGASIFAVKKYATALQRVIDSRDIHTLYQNNLIALKPDKKIAVFENTATKETKEFSYAMIHVTPPMGAPRCIRESVLAGKDGFIEVDKYSLQHVRFPNVFALGDASSLPTSRTGAAIRKQVPVLIDNLIRFAEHLPFTAKYDGYTSCPLVTDYGKLILAEFDYDGNPQETFPFDQSKERYSMYLLKKYGLPLLYWQGMLKGRA